MLILVLSYFADLIFGQPEKFPHPIRAIGWMIEKFENKFNKFDKDDAMIGILKGAVSAIIIIVITMCAAYTAIEISKSLNYYFGLVVSVYIAYVSFTVRELIKAANDVFKALEENSLATARKNLAKIVTRDTKNLDEKNIIKATIESTSENLNDSVVAPLFYLIIGGPVMAIGYRAVNTLDAMIGYKSERYKNFGWFSAKFDDVLSFIPARITGILICISASILDGNLDAFKRSFKIMSRDGRKHESPNAGISEAAMAGALGIKLGGCCYLYPDGKKKCKEEIGDENENVKIEKNLIKKCTNITFIASACVIVIGIIILEFFVIAINFP